MLAFGQRTFAEKFACVRRAWSFVRLNLNDKGHSFTFNHFTGFVLLLRCSSGRILSAAHLALQPRASAATARPRHPAAVAVRALQFIGSFHGERVKASLDTAERIFCPRCLLARRTFALLASISDCCCDCRVHLERRRSGAQPRLLRRAVLAHRRQNMAHLGARDHRLSVIFLPQSQCMQTTTREFTDWS